MLSVLDEAIENAIAVDCYSDRYAGTRREDKSLLCSYALLGAFEDTDGTVPVKIIAKEFKDKDNKIRLAITAKKIEPEAKAQADGVNHAPYAPPSSSKMSLANLIKEINVFDASLLKYIPDGFLSEEQKLAKQKAIEEEENYVAKYSEEVKEPVDITHNKNAIVNRLKQYAEANNSEDADADYRLVEWAKNGKDRTYMKVKVTTKNVPERSKHISEDDSTRPVSGTSEEGKTGRVSGGDKSGVHESSQGSVSTEQGGTAD